jgi:glycosyltransferase 2 family protein
VDASPDEPVKRRVNASALPWMRVVMAAALIALLCRFADVSFGLVAEELRRASWLHVVFIVALGFCGIFISTLKLRIIAAALGYDMRTSRLLRAYYVGTFFNNFLPTSIGGDVFKINEMRSESVPLSAAASLVIAERASGVAAVLGLSLAVAVGWPTMVTRLGLEAMRWPLVGVIGGFAAAALATLALWRRWLEPIARRSQERRIRGAFYRVASELDAFARRPDAVLAALAVSVLFYGIMALILLLAVRAVGCTISGAEALAIPPLARLPEITPISVAGLGIREGARIWCLTHLGVPPAAAAAIAVLLRLLSWLHAAIGGVVYAVARRSDPRTHRVDEPELLAGAPRPPWWRPLVLPLGVLIFLAMMTHGDIQGDNDASRFWGVESLARHGTIHLHESSPALNIVERDGNRAYALGDMAQWKGRFYSSKPPVLTIALAGLAVLLGWLGAPFPPGSASGPHIYLLTLLSVGGLTVLAFAAFRRRAGRSLPPRTADLVTLAALGGTLFLAYSVTMNHHTIGAGLILLAFLLLGMDEPAERVTNLRLVLAGFCMALTTVIDCGPGFIFSLTFGGYILWRRRSVRPLLFYALGGLAPLLLHSIVQYRTFGTILPVQFIDGTNDYPLSYWRHRAGADAFSIPRSRYWLLTLFSMRGLLLLSPILLVGLAALARDLTGWRRGESARTAAAISIAGGVLFLVAYYSFVASTNFGGSCYGFRWYIGFAPLLALYTLRGYVQWRSSRRFRWMFTALAAFSLFYMLVGTEQPWALMENQPAAAVEALTFLRGF